MPTAPLSGRRAEAARNDTRILEAARAVFVDDPGAPISAVAEHAGVGVGALYRRYPSKEELLRHLCGRTPALHRRRGGRPGRRRRPVGGVRGFMRRCVDSDTNSLTQKLAGTFTPTEELYREAGRAQGLLSALFDRTKATGAVRDDLEVNDVGLLLEQVAALRVGDAERTARCATATSSCSSPPCTGRPPSRCPARRRPGTRSPPDGAPEPAGAQPRPARAPAPAAPRADRRGGGDRAPGGHPGAGAARRLLRPVVARRGLRAGRADAPDGEPPGAADVAHALARCTS